MSTQPKNFLTEAEYLATERRAAYKSEYYRGERFAMAGASRAHNRLVANLLGIFYSQVRNGPCEVYPSDMRVHVPAIRWYTYPDVSVACQKPTFEDAQLDTLLNPSLIAEILSESTEGYDRGRKFELYQSIPSLVEYLLISSDRIRVELYTLQADGKWLLTGTSHLEDTVTLDSIGCRVPVAELYEKVELEEPRLRPRAGAAG